MIFGTKIEIFWILQCDGIPMNLADGPQLQGITFLNIPSTHGGTNMWGDSKARRRRSSASKKSKKKQQQMMEQGASFSSVTDIDLSLAVQGKSKKVLAPKFEFLKKFWLQILVIDSLK